MKQPFGSPQLHPSSASLLIFFWLAGSWAESGAAKMVTAGANTLGFTIALQKPMCDFTETTSMFYIAIDINKGSNKWVFIENWMILN